MNMSIEIPEGVQAVMRSADCAGPASEELVTAVEGQFRIVFPKQYRAFLRKFGAALCGGFEIYGLVDASPTGEPPIWSDLREYLREEVEESLVMGLLPISDNGEGYRFLLRTDPKSESVVVYGPGLDRVPVAEDFFDFLARAAKDGVSSLIPRGEAR